MTTDKIISAAAKNPTIFFLSVGTFKNWYWDVMAVCVVFMVKTFFVCYAVHLPLMRPAPMLSARRLDLAERPSTTATSRRLTYSSSLRSVHQWAAAWSNTTTSKDRLSATTACEDGVLFETKRWCDGLDERLARVSEPFVGSLCDTSNALTGKLFVWRRELQNKPSFERHLDGGGGPRASVGPWERTRWSETTVSHRRAATRPNAKSGASGNAAADAASEP
jgi:hypothetical protein